MKNIGRFLGIIAILVIIGLAAGCEKEAEPDDQITIAVTGLPAGANGKYAIMGISEDGTTYKAVSSAPKIISGNQAETAMNFAESSKKNNGKAFGEKGNYFILLAIYDVDPVQNDSAEPLYDGKTSDKKALVQGSNTVEARAFYPEPTATYFPEVTTPDPSKPEATDYGTYKATYTTAANVSREETVVISETQFKISDNSQTSGSPDQLTFVIKKWESVPVPTDYTDYDGAYKFTGRITSQQGYVPSEKTAPTASGFTAATVAADVKSDETGTECWMYIYFKGETGSITFIRSAFSKGATGTGITADNKAIITGSESPPQPRVYTKQP